MKWTSVSSWKTDICALWLSLRGSLLLGCSLIHQVFTPSSKVVLTVSASAWCFFVLNIFYLFFFKWPPLKDLEVKNSDSTSIPWILPPMCLALCWHLVYHLVYRLCGHFSWISSVQFRHSVVSDSLYPHGLQHARLPCPSPTPGPRSNSCPSSLCVMPS